MRVLKDVILAGYTTLGLGGPAARFAEASGEEDLIEEVRAADRAGDPLLILGGGSNLVIADAGFPGSVVRIATRGIGMTPAGDDVLVTAAAGEDWDAFVARCVGEGLSGLECLSGIPGQAGATPIQNVGAYGQEVSETIMSVRAYDRALGTLADLSSADCGFGYRTSAFKRRSGIAARPAPGMPPPTPAGPNTEDLGRFSVHRPQNRPGSSEPPVADVTGRFVMLGVTFRLTRDRLSRPVRYGELTRVLGVAEGGRVPLADARTAVLGLRRRKGMVLDAADPDTRSAGSFFTNPVLNRPQFASLQRAVARTCGADTRIPTYPADAGRVKVPAAWLIERAGFGKGYQCPDGARISTKHTLALVNPGGATAGSLLALARQIRDGVRGRFDVELVSEPVLVGARL